jgi:hypothetical protein
MHLEQQSAEDAEQQLLQRLKALQTSSPSATAGPPLLLTGDHPKDDEQDFAKRMEALRGRSSDSKSGGSTAGKGPNIFRKLTSRVGGKSRHAKGDQEEPTNSSAADTERQSLAALHGACAWMLYFLAVHA